MKKLILVLIISGMAMLFGTGSVFAGGSSDSTGEGFHCYLFCVRPGDPPQFAQVMVNDEKFEEVTKKVGEFLGKYILDEGYTLEASVGNLGENEFNICAPFPT